MYKKERTANFEEMLINIKDTAIAQGWFLTLYNNYSVYYSSSDSKLPRLILQSPNIEFYIAFYCNYKKTSSGQNGIIENDIIFQDKIQEIEVNIFKNYDENLLIYNQEMAYKSSNKSFPCNFSFNQGDYISYQIDHKSITIASQSGNYSFWIGVGKLDILEDIETQRNCFYLTSSKSYNSCYIYDDITNSWKNHSSLYKNLSTEIANNNYQCYNGGYFISKLELFEENTGYLGALPSLVIVTTSNISAGSTFEVDGYNYEVFNFSKSDTNYALKGDII